MARSLAQEFISAIRPWISTVEATDLLETGLPSVAETFPTIRSIVALIFACCAGIVVAVSALGHISPSFPTHNTRIS